jgi:hypothetical protein
MNIVSGYMVLRDQLNVYTASLSRPISPSDALTQAPEVTIASIVLRFTQLVFAFDCCAYAIEFQIR